MPETDSLEIDGSPEEVVIAYHERTKHHFNRYARSLGYMDWATQPDPFRRYEGTEVLRLPLPPTGHPLRYDDLYVAGVVSPEPLSIETLSRFFRYGLSLTAWKAFRDTTWPLRANPSSGNLHPTEGYAVLPPVEGFADTAGVYHYAPREHALERRAILDETLQRTLFAPLPVSTFIVGLSSIHWREAWKYGERAFRYCQHDVGHALGALRFAAAALGWSLTLLTDVADDEIVRTLGLERGRDSAGAEREEPDLLALITPGPAPTVAPTLNLSAFERGSEWRGAPNALSLEHRVDWPAIDEVTKATHRARAVRIAEDFSTCPRGASLAGDSVPASPLTAETAILGRRSAVEMDGTTWILPAAFFRMLARLVPTRERTAMPWDAIPWRPRIHLAIFVHRVDGLPPGLYALPRDPSRRTAIQEIMRTEFLWQRPDGCPPGLDLYLLQQGDCRALAARVSCGQSIAGDGAFSLGMIADFTDSLLQYGAPFYRNLFWEAGLIGQVLYLEAEAAGIRATGIGCYFDNPVREVFGITSHGWQSFYHFTVGGPVEDTRLTTLPAYTRKSAE